MFVFTFFFLFLFLTRSYANYLEPVLPVSLHTQLTLLSIKCKYCGSLNLRPYTTYTAAAVLWLIRIDQLFHQCHQYALLVNRVRCV